MSDVADLSIQWNPPSNRSQNGTIRFELGDELHVDRIDLRKASARKKLLDEVSKRWPTLKLPQHYEDLKRRLEELAAEPADESVEQFVAPNRQALLEAMPESVRADARQILDLPDHHLMTAIIDDVRTLGIAGERELVATVYLIGTSRLLERPLAGIVQGPSSSGKSYLIDKIASLFPAEDLILATQMTPQSLFYMPPGSLRHHFVVAGERSRKEDDDTAEATRALREMLSGGRLSKLLPVKGADGRMVTERIEQEGPIAFVESTTLSKVFEEDENRCLMLHTDERREQTKLIVEMTAARYNGKPRPDVQRIIDRHHALQRMLPQQPVSIPFSEGLAHLFQIESVVSRRAFGQLLNLVSAFTILHFRHRQIDADGRLIAAANDYELARHLLLRPMSRILSGAIGAPAWRFYEQIQPTLTEPFTTRDATRQSKASQSSVKGWFRELADKGWLEVVEPSRGSAPAKWRFAEGQRNELIENCLPTAEQLFART